MRLWPGLPTIIRGFLFGLLAVAAVVVANILLAVVAVAQTTTDCHRNGNAQVCQARDRDSTLPWRPARFLLLPRYSLGRRRCPAPG